MFKWIRESALAYALAGEPEVDPNDYTALFASEHLKAGDPDVMIANIILQDFAKFIRGENTDWETHLWDARQNYYRNNEKATLRNRKKGIELVVPIKKDISSSSSDWVFTYSSAGVTVNDLPFQQKVAKPLLVSIVDLFKRKTELEAAARKAKLEMEQNEAKWEIIEKSLNMKRVNGALVPKDFELDKAEV